MAPDAGSDRTAKKALSSWPWRVAFMCLLVSTAGCRDEKRIEVRNLSLEGVEAIEAGELRRALATRESSFLPWGTKRYFNREAFDADLERIPAFYAERGFPNARVVSFRIDSDPANQNVDLTIVIEEGPPLVVEDAQLVGFEVLSPGQVERLLRDLPLKPGEPLGVKSVQRAQQLAVDALRDSGYAYAKVSVADAVRAGGVPGAAAGPGAPAADGRRLITITATPGPISVFGPIEIAGNERVDDETVRRQLVYRPGELFRQRRLRESQRKLFALELFEFVNVERLDRDGEPSEVATRVTVVEADHRRLEFSAGYGTEEQVRVAANLRHVNFFGGARTAQLEGRYSSLNRGVAIDFGQPYLGHPRLSLGLSGRRRWVREPAFDLDTLGGSVTTTYLIDNEPAATGVGTTTASATFTRSQEQFAISNEVLADLTLRDDLIALGLDPRTGTGSGTLSAVTLELQRNRAGNLLNATRGYLASVQVEQAGWWLGGSFRYTELLLQGRHYLPLGERRVWANRIRFGALHGPGTSREGLTATSIPFFKRYFLGGSTSLRGWGRLQVSPLSASGLPLGGLTMIEASSEIRWPLTRSLGLVFFLDAGNVWPDSWDVTLTDLRYTVGPGLRYDTRIGPVRADVGYQLTPIQGLLVDGQPERRRWRVHFSIGQAF